MKTSSAENPSEVKEFFTNLGLSHLFSVLKSSLQVLVQIAEQSSRTTDTLTALDSSFQKLVHTSGALYCMSDFIHLPLDLCQFLIFLVSIPWLARCDPPWIDLPHGFGLSVDGMARVGRSLGPVIDLESKVLCLHLLAALDAAPTWRTQVFLLVLQKDTAIDAKIAALKQLSLLLCSLGSFSFHLISDVLPGLLSCGEAVQEEIAKVIGSLACILTENTVIRKLKEQLSFDDPVCSSITFLCPDCDPNFQNKTGNKDESKLSAIVNAAIFTQYLQLLSPDTNAAIKCAFINSMKRMFTHIAFTADYAAHSSIVSATCFDLIEDPDFDVRMAFR